MRGWRYHRAAWAALLLLSATIACTSSETSLTAPSITKCQFSLSSSPSTFTAGGGNGSLTVTTTGECTWTVVTDAGWISINGERNGQGAGSVPISVAANPAPSARSGSIGVGSTQVQVNQAAAACHIALARSSDAIGSAGGQLSVDVSTLGGCQWTASTSEPWIAIASGQSGNGGGSVHLTVAANPAAARVGRVTIGGETFTVAQSATPPPPAPGPPPPPSPPPGHSPDPEPPGSGHPPDPVGVTFSGTPAQITGVCPAPAFVVGPYSVVTDSSTRFRGISCSDLVRTRHAIEGEGILLSGGIVHATSIKDR